MITGVAHVLIVALLAGAGVAVGLWRAAVHLGSRAGSGLGPRVERHTGRIGRTGVERAVGLAVGRVTTPLLLWAAVMTALAVLLAVGAWDLRVTPPAVALGLIAATVAVRRIPRLARLRLRRRETRRTDGG